MLELWSIVATRLPAIGNQQAFWMFISLQINNVDVLPAGVSLGYRSRDRSFEIGRENCDWILPDPDKFISGRHCEVRYEGRRVLAA